MIQKKTAQSATRRTYQQRAIILINEETHELKDFASINSAASFLGTNFSNMQRAAVYNGIIKGWKVYESPKTIRKHILELQEQLAFLESQGIH